MITSLRTRLMASYALLAAFAILAVSLSANLFMESRFTRYVEDRIAAEKQQTVARLAAAWTGTWNHDELSMIGMAALERGLIVRLAAPDGTVVWDARTHNNGMCEQMMTSMAHAMDSRYKGWTGSYREDSFPLNPADGELGTVWIGYYGPFWFNDSELYFLSSLNQLTAASALLALLVAAVFGWFMSRWLARPIQQVTATAHRLRQGDLAARSTAASGIREIADLSVSINSLAHDLDEQEGLRRRLTSDISHELRTPLATLRGQLEAMIDGLWPADAKRLESCREEILRLTRLTGQLEGLARIEGAGNDLAIGEIDLKEFIGQVCTLQESQFRQRGISFGWEAEELRFRADGDRLSQILVNLLSNAAKYTDVGGEVRVTGAAGTWEGQPAVAIRVRDTGCGIPADDLPHIFERFYRVDRSRSSDTGGAGIGLTIAWQLARRHGGTIEVASQPGQGSEFTLHLPLVRARLSEPPVLW